MRPLAVFVGLEALASIVLAALWLGGGATGAVGANVEKAIDSSAPAALPSDAAAEQVRRYEAPEPSVEPRAAETAGAFGIVAHGVVREVQGSPIATASVSFVRDGEYTSGETLRTGAFAVADLTRGGYELRVKAKGFVEHAAEVELDGRAWQRFEVVLEPWTVVKVRFVAPGGGAFSENDLPWRRGEEPEVVATVEPLERDLPLAERPAYRRISVGEWASVNGYEGNELLSLKAAGFAGELRLQREPPLHAALLRGSALLATRPIEAGQSELTFEIDPETVRKRSGEVRLRLLDGVSGAPLAGAQLRLRIGPSQGMSVKTDEAGVARFERVPPGLGLLVSSVAEREQLGLDLRVPPGATVDLGDLVLSPLAAITGRVLDEHGQPVTNASIDWWELDRRSIAPLCSARLNAATNGEGRFTLRGAGRHRYALVAQRGYRFAAYAAIDARHGDPEEVVLRLAATTKVRLPRASRAPDGMVLSVHHDEDSPVRVISFAEAFAPSQLFLAPGSYTAQLHDAHDQLVHTAKLVVGREPVTLELP